MYEKKLLRKRNQSLKVELAACSCVKTRRRSSPWSVSTDPLSLSDTCRSLNSPCRRSSWTGGWRRLSPRCSAPAPGSSRRPGRRAAAPAGTRCSWWRCAGSPPWAAAGWGWPTCSASGSRRRRWLCWAAGAPAAWPPSAGPRWWSSSCRPCRPRAGSGPPGGARWGRGRARRPPLLRGDGGAAEMTGRRMRRRKGRVKLKRRSRPASGGPHGPAAGPGPRRSACRWCWSRGHRRNHPRRGWGKRYPTAPWFSPTHTTEEETNPAEQRGGAEEEQRRNSGSGFGGNVESCHKLFCPLSGWPGASYTWDTRRGAGSGWWGPLRADQSAGSRRGLQLHGN